jgi:hypothetical protein
MTRRPVPREAIAAAFAAHIAEPLHPRDHRCPVCANYVDALYPRPPRDAR